MSTVKLAYIKFLTSLQGLDYSRSGDLSKHPLEGALVSLKSRDIRLRIRHDSHHGYLIIGNLLDAPTPIEKAWLTYSELSRTYGE